MWCACAALCLSDALGAPCGVRTAMIPSCRSRSRGSSYPVAASRLVIILFVHGSGSSKNLRILSDFKQWPNMIKWCARSLLKILLAEHSFETFFSGAKMYLLNVRNTGRNNFVFNFFGFSHAFRNPYPDFFYFFFFRSRIFFWAAPAPEPPSDTESRLVNFWISINICY